MAKLLALIALGSLLVIQFTYANAQATTVEANTCLNIEPCFEIEELRCAQGTRTVCLTRQDNSGCRDNNTVGAIDEVCVKGEEFEDNIAGLMVGQQICAENVAGGSLVTFGIRDGERPTTGSLLSGRNSMTLDLGEDVQCEQFDNVCSTGGSRDIPITFRATECPGSGTRTGAGGSGSGRVDGRWADWGEWSSCSSTCRNAEGRRTRRRLCVDQANGGSFCSGSSVMTESCFGFARCRGGGGNGGGGRRRRCPPRLRRRCSRPRNRDSRRCRRCRTRG